MQDSCAQVLSQRGAVFKTVPRPSACNPGIFELRMAVDQEIAVPCIFVLAYARFDNRRILQRRYVLLQIFAQADDGRFCYHTPACIRIKTLSMQVKSDLESSSF